MTYEAGTALAVLVALGASFITYVVMEQKHGSEASLLREKVELLQKLYPYRLRYVIVADEPEKEEDEEGNHYGVWKPIAVRMSRRTYRPGDALGKTGIVVETICQEQEDGQYRVSFRRSPSYGVQQPVGVELRTTRVRRASHADSPDAVAEMPPPK